MRKLILNYVLIVAFSVLLLTPHALAQGQRLITVAVFGDSLSAGYNLPLEDAFPEQLQKSLKEKLPHIRFKNLGVSGDTTLSGLERLEWSLNEPIDAVILALGANDMLRGLSVQETRRNLNEIITRLKQKNIAVFLVGMKAAPNMGLDYQTQFDGLFPALAKEHGVMLYPFFLEGVAGNLALNQKDGIHPTKEGVALMVQNILPTLELFLLTLK